MTRVSDLSCTGVRERRYEGTWAGRTPATVANAWFLAGAAPRARICFSTSQAATSRLPP
ncbi:hypothetical protein A7X85_42130 [Streptomyces sp. ST1015]|nr:hypothetical protein A7X85_42130 [Streptomyces sp. ST1015]